MTGRRTRQTSDAILTSSEHPIALSHTPAQSNPPQISRSAREQTKSRAGIEPQNEQDQSLTHGRCLHVAVAMVVVVVVAVLVLVVAEGLELEIRLLRHLLRKQPLDLVMAMVMVVVVVVVMLVVHVPTAAAAVPVVVVVRRLLVPVVVEGAGGVRVPAGGGERDR